MPCVLLAAVPHNCFTGEVDAQAIQYMRIKTRERRLVLQAYESSKEHKKEAMRLLHAPHASSTGSIFDWSFD